MPECVLKTIATYCKLEGDNFYTYQLPAIREKPGAEYFALMIDIRMGRQTG